jgi:hypothetical protein
MAEGKEIEEQRVINHPYMKRLQSTLQTHKALLACLEKRIVLLGQNASTATEYELNENEITRIKTGGEIDILKRIIAEKEKYFINFMHQFVQDLEEVEQEYDSLLIKAQESKKDEVRNVLYNVKWDAVQESIEVKIHLYKRLKKLLK